MAERARILVVEDDPALSESSARRVALVRRCGVCGEPRGTGARASEGSGLSLAEMERQYIQSVLAEHGGQRAKAAEALGIDPKTLYNKLGAAHPREGE